MIEKENILTVLDISNKNEYKYALNRFEGKYLEENFPTIKCKSIYGISES